MATPRQLEQAENIAAHAAMKTFVDTLVAELQKLEQATVMDALGNTGHVHYAFVTGTQPGVIKFTVHFDNSEMAKTAVFNVAAKRGDI
jgi:hypothetical protein